MCVWRLTADSVPALLCAFQTQMHNKLIFKVRGIALMGMFWANYSNDIFLSTCLPFVVHKDIFKSSGKSFGTLLQQVQVSNQTTTSVML